VASVPFTAGDREATDHTATRVAVTVARRPSAARQPLATIRCGTGAIRADAREPNHGGEYA
jgi:hypothetical protein